MATSIECESHKGISNFDASALPFYPQSELQTMYSGCCILDHCPSCRKGYVITDKYIETHMEDLLRFMGITTFPPKEDEMYVKIDGATVLTKPCDYSRFLREWLLTNVIDPQIRKMTREWISSVGKEGKMMGEFYGFDPLFESVELPPTISDTRDKDIVSCHRESRKMLSFTWPQPQVLVCLYTIYSGIVSYYGAFSFGKHRN